MTKLGRYTVEEELGRGSMGVVYLAHDPQIRRRVAVKTISLPGGLTTKQREDYRTRFLREAQAAGSLTHPGIVTIYGVEALDDHDLPFITMEYVAGRNLQHVLATEGRLVPERAFQLAMSLAEALQSAHAVGIIHRDIKPANILIRDKDGVAKITDFGVARVPMGDLTENNGVLGSPAYMAPEQISRGESDQRSDLFSLAAILYEALTGSRLFSGDDLVTIAHKVMNDPVPRVSSRVRGMPSSADAFFERALAKDPDDRFANGAAFREAINEVLLEMELDQLSTSTSTTADEPFVVVAEHSPSGRVRALGWSDRRLLGTAVGVLLLFFVVVLGIATMVGPDGDSAAVKDGGQANAPADSAARSTGPSHAEPVSGAREGESTDVPEVLTNGAPEAVREPAPPKDPPVAASEPVAPKTTPAPKPTASKPAPTPAKTVAPVEPKKTPESPVEPSPEAAPAAVGGDPADAEVAMDSESGTDPAVKATDNAAPTFEPVAMGSLLIAVTSKIKSGTLRVLVDGEEIHSQVLVATGKKFNRLLKKVTQKAHQATEEAIEVPAGAHTITVRLQIDGKAAVSEASLEVDLSPGTTQTLEIDAGRKFGFGDALNLRLGA